MNARRHLVRFQKLLQLFSHATYRRGLSRGVGAAIEHEVSIQSLGLATLVDVGANKGQFSLLTRRLYPEALIHAFEPLSEPAAQYRRLFAGDGNVVLHEFALGDEEAETEINISGRADSSSLLEITNKQEELFPGTASVGRRTIRVATGDSVLDGVDLPRPLVIKLDVQGFELNALRGMPKLLAMADHVYAEISFTELYAKQPLADEIIDFLRGSGFRLSGVYNLSSAPDGTSVQADALFTSRA